MTQGRTNPISEHAITSNKRQRSINVVGEDPRLTAPEKETIISWATPDEKAHVLSEQAGVIRRLLRHPLFRGGATRVYDERSDPHTPGGATGSAGRITAIQGNIPIGAVKVQASSRSSSAAHKVVSKQAQVSLQARRGI